MKATEIINDEDHLRYKAGIIPYTIRNGEVRMLFMIPSDPRFGGDKPCIVKGGDDPEETPEQTALREGEEEIGLTRSSYQSVFQVGKARIKGQNSAYDFFVFAAEAIMPAKVKLGWEVGSVQWLSMDEFLYFGKKEHAKLVQQAYNSIIARHK